GPLRLRLLLVLLLRALVGGVRRARLLAAVVRRVEARALEVHRHGVEDALDGGAAGRAARQRVVTHALHDLEGVPVLAAVFVDGHGESQYRSGSWRSRRPG